MRLRTFLDTIVRLLPAVLLAGSTAATDTGSFWSQQRKGANIFNEQVTSDLIREAKANGIDFIRLAPDKLKSAKRDFLIGDCDSFTGIVPEDLVVLTAILDTFALNELPVVLTMLSLPGSRWKQNNGDRDDLRIWTNPEYIEQSARFWRELAEKLKGHPAIAGYNLLNEPHPDRLPDNIRLDDAVLTERMHAFNERLVAAIRAVDSVTPIIVDAGGYANPRWFEQLQPLSDTNLLYSFHMYEPYSYTNKKENDGKYSYPGEAPYYGKMYDWNRESLEKYMQPVADFQQRFEIPASKILVGEFGGHRTSKGLEQYFGDLIDIFNAHGWHWAVYAFREDTWDGMDYELGSDKLPWSYWQAIDSGKVPVRPYKPDNPVFKLLRNEWEK